MSQKRYFFQTIEPFFVPLLGKIDTEYKQFFKCEFSTHIRKGGEGRRVVKRYGEANKNILYKHVISFFNISKLQRKYLFPKVIKKNITMSFLQEDLGAEKSFTRFNKSP